VIGKRKPSRLGGSRSCLKKKQGPLDDLRDRNWVCNRCRGGSTTRGGMLKRENSLKHEKKWGKKQDACHMEYQNNIKKKRSAVNLEKIPTKKP